MKAALALAALLAAAPALAYPPNPYSNALARLDPLRRAAVLRQAIIDHDFRCGRVDQVRQVPPFGNLLGWGARCTPGGDFLAFIGPDGTVQVRSCTDARKLKIAGCPAPTAPAPSPRRRGA